MKGWMKKINKVFLWIFFSISVLTFFTSIRIIALYYYYLQASKGNQTLAMTIMDKLHPINFTSYVMGGLHFLLIGVIIMIILERWLKLSIEKINVKSVLIIKLARRQSDFLNGAAGILSIKKARLNRVKRALPYLLNALIPALTMSTNE